MLVRIKCIYSKIEKFLIKNVVYLKIFVFLEIKFFLFRCSYRFENICINDLGVFLKLKCCNFRGLFLCKFCINNWLKYLNGYYFLDIDI